MSQNVKFEITKKRCDGGKLVFWGWILSDVDIQIEVGMLLVRQEVLFDLKF